MGGYTKGPWAAGAPQYARMRKDPEKQKRPITAAGQPVIANVYGSANARLIASAPDLLEALHEGRRAIGDHNAPNDCYATGPLTGDAYRDLVECPACRFIAMYDAAISRATGEGE